MKYRLLIVMLLPWILPAQGLFDSVTETSSGGTGPEGAEINGFVRGVWFGGRRVTDDAPESRAGYGELGLKFKAKKGDFGDGFAELRFRRGTEFGDPVDPVQIREAYVSLYLKSWDIRMGEQIVVWGRADGYNPTNNLTPQDMLVRSGDEDDRRLGNFMIRAFYNRNPFRLELIWAPQYAASVLPLNLFDLPAGVTLEPVRLPEPVLKNGTFAARLNLEMAALDGSVSWTHAFMPLPGIDARANVQGDGTMTVNVMPRPYQMDVFGADLSTTAGSFGLRAEAAYRRPAADYRTEIYVPHPDLQIVFGGDRTWGNFSLILQSVTRIVSDYEPFTATGAPADEIFIRNRMIAMQQEEVSTGFTLRPAWTFFHETVTVEALSLADVTTEAWYVRPKITWSIADALSLTAGGDFYGGPDDTLFGTIDQALNSVFMELRASF